MKRKRQQPTTPAEWLDEIQLAIADAAGEPFDLLVREPDRAVNLFHFAPLTAMKFRGLNYRNEKLRLKVTEGALANYVANSNPDGIDHGLESRPLLAFAVCYVTAHYVLDLMDEREAEGVLEYCEEWLG